MYAYKEDDNLNDRINDSLNMQGTYNHYLEDKAHFEEFMKSSKYDILLNKISYYYYQYKDDICPIYGEQFCRKLMQLLISSSNKALFKDDLQEGNSEYIINQKNETIKENILNLISKILNHNSEMIDSLLRHGLNEFIDNCFPDVYSLKYCIKISKHRKEKQKSFIANNTLFYNQDKITWNRREIKLYSKFFSSIVKNVYQGIPEPYFDFCHFLIENYDTFPDLNEDGPHHEYDSSTRVAILTSLLTLIQASGDYVNEMLKRGTFDCLRIKFKSKNDEEIKELSPKEICNIYSYYLFIEDVSKREILLIFQILTVLANDENYSQYLITNGFIDLIFNFYEENKHFHIKSKKKVLCAYLVLLGDMVFKNQNTFFHPRFMDKIMDLKLNFEEYHYKAKTAIFRLLYIIFDRAPIQIFNMFISNDFHLIFLEYIDYTDISDRLHVLNACLKIFSNCPKHLLQGLCESALASADFIGFLMQEQPTNDDSQKIADLILQRIHQFDEQDNE